MYTQFFGNYLLKNELITPEQLLHAIQYKKSVHLQLGVIAIHAGYMTASEVEKIHILQTHKDRRFGELAVEEGYMSTAQVEKLLCSQKPDYLLLSQALVDNGFMTPTGFENAMINYQSEHELTDMDFENEQQDKILELMSNFFSFKSKSFQNYYSPYFALFFNNLIRFIGEDFTPYRPSVISAYPSKHCVSQYIQGEFHLFTALDMDEQTFIAFASRYAGEDFDEIDEYVRASVEDFINLHNGLFSVNISNEQTTELSLSAPELSENAVLSPAINTYYLPIAFTFGIVNFIFAELPPE